MTVMQNGDMSTEGRVVRVRVSFTLDVDADTWSMEYGTESIPEVREDVRLYVRTLLQQCDAGESNLWTVHG